MPKPDAQTKALFEALLPNDPKIHVKPLFGNYAAFLEEHMFLGIFGSDLFLRLDERGRKALMREPDSGLFEPLKGRPMAEYVRLPSRWKDEPKVARRWVQRSLRYAASLPPKVPKGKRSVRRRAPTAGGRARARHA